MAKLFYKKKEKVKLIFRNPRYNAYVSVLASFTCYGCANLEKEIALSEDLQEADQILDRVKHYNSKIYFQSESFSEKQKSFFKKLYKTHNYLYWFGIMEIVMIVVVSMIQIFMIKNLVMKKRLF